MQEQEHDLLQGNNSLQQPDAMEQPGSETQATIEALTELLKSSEALLELHQASEARFQDIQQVLQTIEHTRAYRLLHRLGRWRFMEQGLSELPSDVLWRTGDPSSPVLQLPTTQTLSAYKTAIDAVRQVLQALEHAHVQGQKDGAGSVQQLVAPERLAQLLAEHYAMDRTLFPLWETHGFHIIPVHFYSPLPQVSALPEVLWTQPSELVGIDVNVPEQLQFLDPICLRFQAEYDAFPHAPTDIPYEYYLDQNMFRSVDAEVLYCMIRHYRPHRVIEVGSGFSTYLSAAAVRQNTADGHPATFVAIEPYPNEVLRHGFPGLSQLLVQPLQSVGLDLFTSLTENDILFIDSSHVLRIDSDVRFLFLEVLPRLQPGVLVHFHDIFLPCEYPRDWVMHEYRFWNEQYLLQAFLAFNRGFEVLWSGSYMHLHHREHLQKAFRSYDPATVWPGSFWIRRLAI